MSSGIIFTFKKKDIYLLLLSYHFSSDTCMLYWFTMGVGAISSFIAVLAHKISSSQSNQNVPFHNYS